MGLGTGVQPADIADISSLETASPVTQSIGFQPKHLRWTVIDSDDDSDSVGDGNEY